MSRARRNRLTPSVAINANPNTQQKAKKAKRHNVAVGDIVAYYTMMNHVTGSVGQVVAVVSPKLVVVKSLGGQRDDDYGDQSWAIRTAKPTGQTPSGEDKWRYSAFITKVIQRVNPEPPKTKKPVKLKQLDSVEALTKHLASGKGKAVFAPALAPTDGSEEAQP